MPSPFYNAVKSTTSGAPGTGSFTPNAAASGFRNWTGVVPALWCGLVRYDDGTDWELRYGSWNGTSIARPTNGFHSSSTGSGLTLSASATASLVPDAMEVMSHFGGVPWRGYFAVPNNATPATTNSSGLVSTGTNGAIALTHSANIITSQPRVTLPMATTTVNSQCGWTSTNIQGVYSTSAGIGGGEVSARLGPTVLGNGPRLMVGAVGATWAAVTGDPSAHTQPFIGFLKDAADTNIQFATRAAAGSATKVDTGIPWAVNGWYEFTSWWEAGGGTGRGLIYNLQTGDVWFGSSTTNLPATGSTMLKTAMMGIGTAGTAGTMHIGQLTWRGGQ